MIVTTTGGTTGGVPAPTLTGWSATCVVDGAKDGQLLSGTNVRVTPEVDLEWQSLDDSLEYFSAITIVDCRLYVGGYDAQHLVESVPIDRTFFTPAKGSATVTYSLPAPTLAFASTHFAPDKPIMMVVEADIEYTLEGDGTPGGGTTGGGTLPDLAQTTINPVAYNKGLTLSTDVVTGSNGSHRFGPDDGPYSDPSEPAYILQAPTAWRTCADARTSFNLLHHSLVDSGDELTKVGLLNSLGSATAFFALTHGDPGGIVAYPPEDSGLLEDYVSFSDDIPNAVKRLAGVPALNVVVMHACQTVPDLINQPDGIITNAYQAFFGQTIIPDTAYLGFTYEVSSTLNAYDPKDSSTWAQCLDLHANDVYQQLQLGLTVEEAINHANSNFHPIALMGGKVDVQEMACSGDTFARLISVYTGKASPTDPNTGFPIPPTAWYRILNP